MDVKEITVPQQHHYDGISFPLILSPVQSSPSTELSTQWVRNNRQYIEEKLVQHGAILFRGFNLSTAQDFYDFTLAFGYEFGSYRGGGGPRNVVLGPIHTSTESPPEIVIPFHHELAYLPNYPSKLFFFAEIPTPQDGETPILLSNRVYQKLVEKNKEFVQQIAEKKVRYKRLLESKAQCHNKYQRSWQEIFDTDDKVLATQRANETGIEKIEWLPDDSMLVTSIPLDGLKVEPRTGKWTWFNSIVLLHPGSDENKSRLYSTTYGDFTPISETDVKDVADIMQSEGVKIPYHKGDVYLIDNTLALHARNIFTPPRRILAAIIK